MRKFNIEPTKEWLEQAYLKENKSAEEIAEIVGCHRGHVYWLLNKHHITTRRTAIVLDEDTLRRLYVTDGVSAAEIAQRYDVAENSVYNWLRAYHIPLRQQRRKGPKPDREWLLEQRYVKGRSWKSIMDELEYATASFHQLLKDYNIERKQYVAVQQVLSVDELRRLHVDEGMTAVQIAVQYGCNHTTVSRLIKRYGLDPQRRLVNHRRIPPISSTTLEDLYYRQGKPVRVIASEYGVSMVTVRRWLMDYGFLPPPQPSKTTKVRSDTNPNTRFGARFDAEERFRILTRDNWTCQMSGCGRRDRWALEVHHITPVSNGGTHDPHNGITLCRPCHVSIKGKESEYAALFQGIVNSIVA